MAAGVCLVRSHGRPVARSSVCRPTQGSPAIVCRRAKTAATHPGPIASVTGQPDPTTCALVALVPLLLFDLLRLLLLRDLLGRLGQLGDLRSESAQLGGQVIRTVGALCLAQVVDLLPQNVNRIRQDHQGNQDRRSSFLERVDAGICVWHFGGRLGNQLFNLCPGTHVASVGPKRRRPTSGTGVKPRPLAGSAR